MPEIEVFSWNPQKPVMRGRVGRRIPWKRPINNFGDLLGPLIVSRLAEQRGLGEPARIARLLSVGSVLHFAKDGDVVWGSGVNAKASIGLHVARRLDVRAVRGPRTRAFLAVLDIDAPPIYGDPALLLALVMPELLDVPKAHEVTVVPNFHDMKARALRPSCITQAPTAPLHDVLRRIAASHLVVGSSLHGIIVAEALGVPARLITPKVEPEFKYRDYYEGTGRPDYKAASSVTEAIRLGGESPPVFDPRPLLDAFPADLWAQN